MGKKMDLWKSEIWQLYLPHEIAWNYMGRYGKYHLRRGWYYAEERTPSILDGREAGYTWILETRQIWADQTSH